MLFRVMVCAVVIFPSSGTGAWEAALANALSPGDCVLACQNGHFAAKWVDVATRLGFATETLAGDWRQGVDPAATSSLDNGKVLQAVGRRVKAALKDFPGYAKIRQFSLSLEPWSVEEGLITPTLKVKRPKVLERYAAEVERMYSGGPAG